MKKQFLLIALFASLIAFSFTTPLFAQTSVPVSGDYVCGGSTPCPLTDLKKVISGFNTQYLIPGALTFTLISVFFIVLLSLKAKAQGDANAIKTARSQAGNVLIGLLVITLFVGGFFTVLMKYLGLQTWVTQFFNISTILLNAPHAYAATYLPNPYGVSNVYDLLLLVLTLFVKWAVYPGLIVVWVWSGFSYVLAQGNPEKISNAHSWLLWAVGSTIIVLVAQGFFFALQGTISTILS